MVCGPRQSVPFNDMFRRTWWISRMLGNDLRRDPSLLFCDLTQVTDEASILLVKTIQVRINCALRMRARSEK